MHTKAILGALGVTVALGFGSASWSQSGPFELAENSPVKRIITVGEDGGMFFVVKCQNGKEGSIEKYDDPPQVCVGPPRECKSAWDLVRAAEHMCRLP